MVRSRTAVFLRLGTGPDGVSLSQLVHLQDDEGQQVLVFLFSAIVTVLIKL